MGFIVNSYHTAMLYGVNLQYKMNGLILVYTTRKQIKVLYTYFPIPRISGLLVSQSETRVPLKPLLGDSLTQTRKFTSDTGTFG